MKNTKWIWRYINDGLDQPIGVAFQEKGKHYSYSVYFKYKQYAHHWAELSRACFFNRYAKAQHLSEDLPFIQVSRRAA